MCACMHVFDLASNAGRKMNVEQLEILTALQVMTQRLSLSMRIKYCTWMITVLCVYVCVYVCVLMCMCVCMCVRVW